MKIELTALTEEILLEQVEAAEKERDLAGLIETACGITRMIIDALAHAEEHEIDHVCLTKIDGKMVVYLPGHTPKPKKRRSK